MADNNAPDAPNLRRYKDQIAELPQFFGNSKDTLTADAFINRVETAAEGLGWEDADIYKGFRHALRENAEEWIGMLREIDHEFDTLWTVIKPKFRVAFGSKLDESKIYMTCKDLQMKVAEKESPLNFGIRFISKWKKIKEMIKPKAINVPAAEAGRTIAYCQGLYMQGCNDTHAEYQRIFYVAGLPQALLAQVVQKDIPTMPLAIAQATRIFDLKNNSNNNGNGNGNGIHEVKQSTDDEFVNQIRTGNNYGNGRGNGNRGGNRGRGANRGQSYSRGNSSGSRGGSTANSYPQGSTQSQAAFKCAYCSKAHHQDKCYKRIADKKPCISSGGKPYWPKMTRRLDLDISIQSMKKIQPVDKNRKLKVPFRNQFFSEGCEQVPDSYPQRDFCIINEHLYHLHRNNKHV